MHLTFCSPDTLAVKTQIYGQTRMDGQGNFRQVWKIRDAHEAFVQGL